MVAVKGGVMCDKERAYLLSKYFYGECTKFGEFNMQVCIVLVDSLEELKSWLANPSEAADLMKKAQRLLKEAQDWRKKVEEMLRSEARAELEAIDADAKRLGPSIEKCQTLEKAMDLLQKRQAFLDVIGSDAEPED